MKLLWRAAHLRHSGALSFVLFCFLKDLNHRLPFQSGAFEMKEAGAAAWIRLWTTTTGSYSELTNNVSLSGFLGPGQRLTLSLNGHLIELFWLSWTVCTSDLLPSSIFEKGGSYSFISLFIKCFLLNGGRSLMDMSDGYMKPSIWFVRSW